MKGENKVEPVKAYACYLKDDNKRMNSSSGAVFSALSSYIFSVNGVVYGVAMADDCRSAVFISVTDEEGLKKLRGSKYLQAKIGDTYKNVKKDLLDGKTVLFTGTGCQINGLKNFLQKDYNNLICVDVICHGVPSPELWRKYVYYQEKKNKGKLKYVNFRCKDEYWTNFGMKEIIQGEKLKKKFISKDIDPYMLMFLRDYCLRPSCYECIAKKVKKSDITIADFWGIHRVATEMNDGKGTSLVLIRSEHGEQVFNLIRDKMKWKEVSYEDGVRGNPAEYSSPSRPSQRDTFFEDMANLNFNELVSKYAVPTSEAKKIELKRKIKHIIAPIIQKRGGYNIYNYGVLFIFFDFE